MVFDLFLVKMLYCAKSDTVRFGLEIILLRTLLRDCELENLSEAADILLG